MSDLSTMKARIADELARSDLTSQIASAITTAIERYQSERFWFNESRSTTFSTVAGQALYGSSDNSAIPDFYTIDWAAVIISSVVHELGRVAPKQIEFWQGASNTTGQPTDYAWWNKQIWLYPKPSDAWTVRLAGHLKVAAPASDSETGNVWMTDAERLIRARAKWEIATHVTQDPTMAAVQAAAVDEALAQYAKRTAGQTGTGLIRPTVF